MTDVLSCPGNTAGLFLRYKNANPDADPYVVPTPSHDQQSRYKDSTQQPPAVVITTWPYLALVKVDDMPWLASQEFLDIPRTSKILPKEPDGSDGSAFTFAHAGLRSYKAVGKIDDPTALKTRPKYIVVVQSNFTSEDDLQSLDLQYAHLQDFRGAIRYQLETGYLGFQEAGPLPAGLVLYEFDGDEPPRSVVDDKNLMTEVWSLTHEAGNSSLRL